MDKRRSRIRIPKKSKIAFVCSGGAAKAGAFHLGVALALQEKGFKFLGGLKRERAASSDETGAKGAGGAGEPAPITMTDGGGREIKIYVGSSAGSIICSYLAGGYTLDQIFDAFLGKRKVSVAEGKILKRLTYGTMFSLRKDEGLLNTFSILTEGVRIPSLGKFVSHLAKDSYENIFKWRFLKLPGLFSTAGIERYLREDVLPSNDFHSYDADLFIVATQLNHSRKVVFGKYKFAPDDKTVIYVSDTKISQAAAASTALPPVFAPYPIKNEKGHNVYYFDGEIRDTLSTHVGFDAGADLIIASYSHQPYHFSREIGSLHQFGLPAILIQALYLLIERKIQHSLETHNRNAIALDSVSRFFREHNLPDHLRTQCLDLLERKLGHKSGVQYIYIHPKSTDHAMFFGDHFNLSGKKMSEIVRLGFRCAIDSLRRYEFE